MIKIRQNKAWGLEAVSGILLLCIVHVLYARSLQPRPAKIATAEARNVRSSRPAKKAGVGGDPEETTDSPLPEFRDVDTQGGRASAKDLKFTHLTTSDGLSQSNVTEVLQDRRGFMWFATRDGLNRYDGNSFVVYKHNPNDPGSLSANYIWDMTEDDHGYLWIATDSGGVNRFDPTTERFVRYRHDPNNANSISGDSVETVAHDSRGYLWFGTEDNGLDRFDPSTGTFTHYPKDSDGQLVGRITKVIAGRQGDIWFVGARGLFHLDPQTGQITRPPATITSGLGADYVYEDDAGDMWMLAWSPVVGLVKYDRQTERLTKYPIGAGAVGVASSNLLADGQNGFWVASSQGLHYFDRRTERWTYRFQHDETNPDSLNDNTVASVYRDRGGLLWVGTEDGGLNVLNLRQEQFGLYRHHANNPNSLSPGKVTAIYQEPSGILWIGFLPRRLDRLDRKTGRFTHYVSGPEDKNNLSRNGADLTGIYKDARGYLWLGGWGSGLDRFDERTGQFKHYRHNPEDPNSLLSDGVYRIYGDRSGQIWIGQLYGLSRLDPATEQFTNYRPDPGNWTWNGNSVWGIYQDRSGEMWLGTGGGALIRADDRMKTLANYMPDSRDPHKLNGGAIDAIHEDRAGTLWVGAWDGLYRFNRQNGTFTRYTESQGLPSSSIQGILEDKVGRLWLSTKKGISRFDPRTETFRNYDVSDGLQGDEFSESCYFEGPDGEMFFGGSFGFSAFFPENIRDNPYVPPVVITSLKIFNKPVPIGAKSVLKKAIPYIDSLTLSYLDNVFSFEFAALSYANSQKNRYRYRLEGLEPGWNEVGSKQRLATYTNLDPGKYVFRVQASNSDGVWNEKGVSLPILITPPWWRTNWFRALCGATFLALLWAAYQLRVRQLQRSFKRLRDVIDTIPTIVFEVGPDGSGAIANRRWHGYTGSPLRQHGRFAPEDQAWRDSTCVHPDDLDGYVKLWKQAIATGQSFELETRVRGADGEYRSFLVRHVPLCDKRGKILKWFGTFTDIEDRKRAEEALRRSEAYLADAHRLTHTGAWASDNTTEPLYWSEEVFRVFGFDPHDGLPTRDEALRRIHPEDRGKFVQAFDQAIHGKEDCEVELRVALPEGTVKYIHAIGHPFLSANGEVVEVVGTIADITERKRAEEELRESETRFRTFVDHAADALFVYDLEQRTIVDVNRSACESLGYTREELIGKTPLAFHLGSYEAEMASLAERALRGETVFDRHWHRRKDGSLFMVEVHTSLILYGSRHFLLMVARDITDRLQAEEQRDKLRQLEADLAHINRVSMMGELTASIAHEVNQPLSGVVGNGGACLRWLAGDVPNLEEAREAARRIVRDGKRAGEVIARIRALTRKTSTPREKLDLNETLRQVLALIGDQAKRNSVMIRTQFADDLFPISGDQVQLQQVALNLAMNAIEAMSTVGERPRELVITTRNLEPDQVQVAVEDSGRGIDPQMLDKIFDSFYTTKAGGMGMGLSISRSILQAHGGRLWATAKDGKGTIFYFTLPKYHEEESSAKVAEA